MARAGALRVVNAVLEDRTITHVIVNNKNGLAAYKAKCFIDCTGDADLIKLVGASYQSGNHNRVNQPVSLRFDMAGIDFERFHAYMRSLGNDQYKYFAMNTPGMKDIIRKAYENGVLTEQDACYFQAFGIPGRPDGMNFNCPELTTKENVVDAEFMTQKQLEGKKAIMRLRKFLRDYIPGFENAYITSIAQLVGFRESRRIEAEYMLTIEDVLTYRKFPDGIAASHYPIDVHGVDDVSLGLKYQHDVPADEQYWEVPFRVMIPKTLDNVLTAGRCAGMDFRAQSAARIQPTCRSMGKAARSACRINSKNQNSKFFLQIRKRRVPGKPGARFLFCATYGERGIEIALFFCYNRVNYSLKRFIGGKSVFGKPKCPNKTGFCRKLNIKVREKHADHNRRIRR